ncbi:carboxypeptidase regulatory-like domain-containing protein [Rhodopirellula europaea]|nr:carboxypeptidase regulatory-like domain-containing protein [Rhodopirellula europaea]
MRWKPVTKLQFVYLMLLLMVLPQGQGASDELPDSDVDRLTEIAGTAVDEAGNAVPNAVVEIHYFDGSNPQRKKEAKADSDGKFQFSLPIAKTMLAATTFRAQSDDGSLLTFDRISRDASSQRPLPVQLQLEKTRPGTIQVVDQDNQPVEGANLLVQIGAYFTVDAFATSVPGQYTFSYPLSSGIRSVIAWKNGLGADYELYALSRNQRNDQNAKVPEFPEDGATLQLDGAESVTFIVKDGDGKPLADVEVYPWLLQKESENDQVNLSFGQTNFVEKTGADGQVTFDWMPQWQKSPVTFWLSRDGFVHSRGNYFPSKGNKKLSVVMNRTVPIRGRVVDPAGNPAPGITVVANGRGYATDPGRERVTTEHDGTFEMQVPGEQIYLLSVESEKWASDGVPTFVVNQNQPVDGVELRLRQPTVVTGRITDEATGDPIANERVGCYLYGTSLDDMEDVKIANPDGSNLYVRPMVYFSTQTDDEGRYELKLGNGNYSLRPPQRAKSVEFEVAGELEKQVDASIETIEKIVLQGIVRNAADGVPVPNATLDGIAREFIRTDWKAKSDADGKFAVETDGSAAYIHTTDEHGKLRSITKIDDKVKSVEIELHPVGSAQGVLHKSDSDEPASNTVIVYAIYVHAKDNRSFSPRFGGQVTTDDDGNFILPNLAANHEYVLTLAPDSQGRSVRLGTVFVEPGETVDLGALGIPAPRKPYVPPTLDERIKRAMAVDGTPLQRFSRAVPRVQRSKQMLLIAIGTIDEPRLHDFMQWRYEDSDYRKVRDDYLVMAISTESQEQKEQARELLDELGVKNLDQAIEFSLVLVNADGELIEHVSDMDFIVEEQLSKSHVIDWLDSFRPDPIDARELLKTTLAQAKKENKRVIVQETATWCGPCHMLSDFLIEHRDWEADYLWVKMDHRYTGARELMQELRDGAEGGIPWFAIVDADGKRLVTSNRENDGSNIGFPSSDSGQKHLKHMLMETKLKMTEDEITSFVEHLNDEE